MPPPVLCRQPEGICVCGDGFGGCSCDDKVISRGGIVCMEYTLEGIESFKNSPLLRLLKSDSAVLVFLHKIFVEEKKESISEPELVK